MPFRALSPLPQSWACELERAPGSVAVAETKPEVPNKFANRELSWLAFNERVLEEAEDPTKPPLERLKFLCIFTTNLDEFFMIRVAGLKQQLSAAILELSPDGMSAGEQLRLVSLRAHELVQRQTRCLRDEVLPLLATHNIKVHAYSALPPAARDEVDAYFRREVMPVLTPLAVDPGHPFPHLLNLGLNLGFMLVPRDGEGEELFAVVQVPSLLPRLLPLQGMGPGHDFLYLEDAISKHADDLFPGYRVRLSFPFRLTRDADLEIAEDEADDLLETVEQSLRHRNQGDAVRLEVSTDTPAEVVESLVADLQIFPEDVYKLDIPLNLADLMTVVGLDMPALKDAPFSPRPFRREKGEAVFSRIRAGDIPLHHPYESFDLVLSLAAEAAEDPRVLAIKQTLYRTSGDSPVVKALMRAAEEGKQVTAIVELKARFDEKANIQWAKALEDAGVHVVYGILGLKTHCKLLLVVRREETGLRRYVHFGTGNYNPRTARVYTDIGLLSCRPELGADATQLFNLLTGYSRFADWNKLLVAPHEMRRKLLALIEREVAHARAGRGGRIVAKMNSLADEGIISALYTASQNGVAIDLVIRGICCLRPGVPGLSDNIRVTSIVGRFLEHSRVFHFANGGEDEVYISSADWMSRNLDRRVEITVPVEDPALRDRLVVEVLGTCLADNVQARELQLDGTWIRRTPQAGSMTVNAQRLLLSPDRPHAPSELQRTLSGGESVPSPGTPESVQALRLRGRRRRAAVAMPAAGDVEVPADPDI
ncbi:MAG: polyphosphate kinase 1 [Candidatus Riflebacteria bacterium]|nr:polyphosphate kinase 1 [Candidatus Riflebacteria bacterium]